MLTPVAPPRAEVRDASGTLLVLGNPTHINFPPRQEK